MHVNFLQSSTGCLDHLKETWPINGVLRLEIIKPHQRAYAEQTGTLDTLFTLDESYIREMVAKKNYVVPPRYVYYIPAK